MKERPSQETRNEIVMLSINGSAAKESGEAGSIIACSCVFMCIEVYQGVSGDGRVRYIVCEGHFRSLATLEFSRGPIFYMCLMGKRV